MKPKIKDLLELLEQIAPARLSEEWDNPGLQVGSLSGEAEKIIVALDPTLEAVQEATRKNAQVLMSHHPLLFRPLSRLDRDRYPGNVIALALAGSISIIAAHTNLDAAQGGINDALSFLLGLNDVKPLQAAAGDGQSGLGRIGTLAEPMTLEGFSRKVREKLDAQQVRVVGNPGSRIRTAAVVGGSGGSMILSAHSMGADALVTGDVTHHQALEARSLGLAVIDAGHFCTERKALSFFAENLRKGLRGNGWDVDVQLFQEKDPISYE